MPMNRWVAVPVLTLTLVACGGGGGGGSAAVVVPSTVRSGTASAGSDVSAANAAGFAGVMARAVMSAADDSVPGVSAAREAPQSRTIGAALSGRWLRFAVASAAREQALAVTSQTLACDFGGSVTVTVNDADGNQKLSGGDSASFMFDACIIEMGSPPVTGSLSFTVNAVELDANQQPTALDASLTLAGFTELGFGSLSGSFRIWYRPEGGATRQRLSYLATSVVEPGQVLTYDHDVYGLYGSTGSSFDVNGALTVDGNGYAVSTPTVFSSAAGALPGSGVLTLRDAAGDAVILRARSATTFDLEFQSVGAGTPTPVLTNQAWDSYRL
jgi:hypothetical protein